MKELKGILSALSETKTQDLLSESPMRWEELKPEQMVSLLRRVFGDSVDIIDPALSLQASPIAGGPLQGAGAVLYLQALRQLAAPGTRGPVLSMLKKPIVMLVAQPRQEEKFRATGFADSKTGRAAVIVNAWKAIIIVPRNYQPPEGKPVGNDQNPLFYYFDPQSDLSASQAPREVITFCQVLIKGCQVPAVQQGRPVNVTVEPVFNVLGFFHGCRAMCVETSDSPWWVLYFAIMAVGRGGVKFSETDQLSLSRLQTVLGSLFTKPAVPPALQVASSGAMTSSSFAVEPASSFAVEPASTEPETKESPADLSWLPEALKTVAARGGSGQDAEKKPLFSVQEAGLFDRFHLAVYRTDPEIKIPAEKREKLKNMEYLVRDLRFLKKKDYWLQNTLKYWHEKQGDIQNRQVVYFFRAADGHGLGIVVRWSHPNTALAKQMWQVHRVTDEGPKIKRYLQKADLTRTVPTFYAEVRVMVFRGCEQVASSGQAFQVTGLDAECDFQLIAPDALYALALPAEILAPFEKPAASRSKTPLALPREEKPTPPPVSAPSVDSVDNSLLYTPAIMAGILRAYQIAPAPEAKLSRDSSGGFELTAYPESKLTGTVFLQDLLSYWQAQQGRLENRRVAYVFSAAYSQTGQVQRLGVVIQYSAPNTTLASQCWQENKETRTESMPALLESTLSQAALRFYTQVQVTVLGMAAQPDLVQKLQAPLGKIGRGHMDLNFKAIPVNNAYSVILMEDILGMLQHGQTRDIDPATVVAAHRERCVQAILTRWEQTEHRDALLQQELTAALRTVLIMATLNTQRQSEYRREEENSVSLRVVKARDEAMKRHLYAQRFPDSRALIERLPLTVLASFLITPEVTENLKTLNTHRDELRRELLSWEMDLEARIKHYRSTPCDYVTQAWNFIYYASFLGLGGELFRQISGPLVGEGGSPEEKVSESARDLAAKEARWAAAVVKRMTRSETLSVRSETAARLFLGTEPVSRSLGVLGTLVGAGVQIAFGPYAFVQMLGIAALTLRMQRTIESRRLDDLKAELKEPEFSLTALHRLSVLLWHGGEALVLGSLMPLVSTTGGLAGSAVAMTAATRLLPRRSRSRQTSPTEGAELGGLLIRQGGAMLGQRGMMALFVLAVNVQHRMLYRDTAVALLSHAAARQPGIQEWKIESADFRDPRLWLNSQRNPLTLSWLTPSGAARRVECEIQGLPVLTPTGITGLVCIGDVPATELSTTLGLPRP